ncbi:MAG: precorrin-6Y C5,15-methyltransferase (decarboxylating) subunit CbiT, partial [Lachnospiraceae bacterium]|nr:precorrin-6Y C5,15-methyltransferase (decarboxylating) subunit CbiT [Lachnospiraceae bacterium]
MLTKTTPTLSENKIIKLAGLGPGNEQYRTLAVEEAIANADVIFGAPRLLEAVDSQTKAEERFPYYQPEKILEWLDGHPAFERPVVLFSGDTGFYSGAITFLNALKKREETKPAYETEILCGISSIVYFCSKAKLSWHDVRLLSRHGRECNVIGHLRYDKKCILLLSGLSELKDTARSLIEAREAGVLANPLVTYGYQLSYPEEEICQMEPEGLLSLTKEGLYILYIAHEGSPLQNVTPGIRDSEFLRAKVPMTKEEVRWVSLCKLGLKPDSVLYDIGAGTGSISIEAALLCVDGSVHAVEYKEDAYELLKKNKAKFHTENLNLIHAKAPEGLENLPVPSHAFIGGSAGNMEEIVRYLFTKNPGIRIVVNCIALETLAEVT